MGKQHMRIRKLLFTLQHFRRIIVLTVVLLALGFSGYYVVSPPSVQGISSTIVISQVYGGGATPVRPIGTIFWSYSTEGVFRLM